jgi:hypothetical protein
MTELDFFKNFLRSENIEILSKEDIIKQINRKSYFGTSSRYEIMSVEYKRFIDDIEFGIQTMGLAFCQDGILMGLGTAQSYSVMKFPYNSKFEFVGSNFIGQLFFSVNDTKYQFVSGKSVLLKNLISKLNEFRLILEQIQKEQENATNKLHEEGLKENKIQIQKLLDVDKDNTLDICQGDVEFDLLLKKHQVIVQELGIDYLQKLVKLSLYLRTKRKNLQGIYSQLEQTDTQQQFDKLSTFIFVEIEFYNKLLASSLFLINSLIQKNLISFFSLYDEFDKVGVFNTAHENNVERKLSVISKDISALCDKLDELSSEISYGFMEVVDSTNAMTESLSAELNSINSSINVNTIVGYLRKK